MIDGEAYPQPLYSDQFNGISSGVKILVWDIKRLSQQLQMLLLMMMIVHRFLLFTRSVFSKVPAH